MPYAGDWYLWCIFALHYDVAYISEPMIIRRLHERNITKFYENKGFRIYMENLLAVPWQMKIQAESNGLRNIARLCHKAIIAEYSAQLSDDYTHMRPATIGWEEFEESLHNYASNLMEGKDIRARTLAILGDRYYWENALLPACEHYRRSLQESPWMVSVYAKYALLCTGSLGIRMRAALGAIKRVFAASTARS
jgi:hypothetical protein